MAFQFLSHYPARPLLFSLPLGLSLACLPANPISPFHRRKQTIRCDYGGPSTTATSTLPHSESNRAPATSSLLRGSWLSDASLRQISLGSVLGLFAGIGLRIFSKALVLAVGLGILVVEWAASKGYSIVPKRWIQRHVASIDVQKALTEDMPFKTSFGLTMALSAFAEFNSAFA